MIPPTDKLPEKINRLNELALNLWWSWTPEARELFRRLDYPLWRDTEHNPVQMLRLLSPEDLQKAAEDAAFIRLYNKVMLKYDQEMANGHTWFHITYPEHKNKIIAYFSFEFGLHNSLPIYSGGLGILSGDHAKETSDLGLPFVGIGFMYPQGYFRQRLPSHGWQEAIYKQLDMSQAPIRLVRDDNGNEKLVDVNLGGRRVFARIWHVQVGRTNLYLMDTDVDENDPWDRELSARLYSGDSEMRIRQEIMLGIGGVRVLRTLGIDAYVYHMNEGHSAFLLLELLREKVTAGTPFEEAVRQVQQQSVFTTHTPVPAGHDAFAFHMIDQYFRGLWEELGISREQFLNLGGHQEEWGIAFNMTVLALRLSGLSNGVSKLHGEVSRNMWQEVWPDRPVDEIPITSITNGVHVPSWISSEMSQLFSKYLGPDWREHHDEAAIWERLADIPDEELWHLHLNMKRKMISYFQEHVRRNWVHGSHDPTQVLTGGTLLEPTALTIGFARRFATYKRATLIFRDLERLKKLLLDVHRPVQIVFAGKAHPADDPGKHLIQYVYNMAKNNQLGGRIAFIEDYNMHMARYLVQGVDIWLNTPRRPREASGTSGMKAALNGVPNLSIVDGWWAEGYNGANGWSIGGGQAFDNPDVQDEHDANSIYQLLEDEIVPLFYNRDRDGIPRGWIEIVRESIRSNAAQFSMRRMIKEYTTEMYLKAIDNQSL
ncbi:MAG: alpha-glucan family phosphorylase [Ardenticatenaceae bacterium]|nr:alpha-glucan family phosphorylase [Anaerolineales bacterium]MCB8921914.1 alpha-glucan family phosphorylase [Ardenticatenaceae bacterium]MCB8989489.1 alpha-glucan family phosphorylase [Ardenticatenaceae bacterium]